MSLEQQGGLEEERQEERKEIEKETAAKRFQRTAGHCGARASRGAAKDGAVQTAGEGLSGTAFPSLGRARVEEGRLRPLRHDGPHAQIADAE